MFAFIKLESYRVLNEEGKKYYLSNRIMESTHMNL